MNNSEFATSAVNASPIYLAPSALRSYDPSSYRGKQSNDSSSRFHAEREQDWQQDELHIEAVEMEGRWFALDQERLEYIQLLEKEGNCRRVRVESIPIAQLPDETRTKITEIVTSIKNGTIPDAPVIHGYQFLNDEDKSTNDDALSDSMIGLDSDHQQSDCSSSSSDDDDASSSECGSHYLDWSEDQGDSNDDRSDVDIDKKHRTSADGKSEGSSDDNEQLIGDES